MAIVTGVGEITKKRLKFTFVAFVWDSEFGSLNLFHAFFPSSNWTSAVGWVEQQAVVKAVLVLGVGAICPQWFFLVVRGLEWRRVGVAGLTGLTGLTLALLVSAV